MIAGKRIHGALYLHRSAIGILPPARRALVAAAEACLGDRPSEWNVVKLEDRRPQRVSLLLYEAFEDAAFPALLDSITVDTDTSIVTRRTYRRSSNPPILHRKELLLLPDDPNRQSFQALTEELEKRGLFSDSSKIGFKTAWQSKLAEFGVRIVNHQVVGVDPTLDSPHTVQVDRHKTAIMRDRLSTPMQALVRNELLTAERTVLDYGCGQGDDVATLRSAGINATGWDPYFCPEAPCLPADFVNLGFVLNVIEDVEERRRVLQRAFELAGQCLAVGVMLVGKGDTVGLQPYRDGYVTRRGTFQKYFTQDELREFVEQTLECEAIAASPGIFLVFRDKVLEQRYLLGRQSRRMAPPISWVRTLTRSRQERLIEQHIKVLEALWQRMLDLGRSAHDSELEESLGDLINNRIGGLRKAERLCLQAFDVQLLSQAAQSRREDLRVYFALNLFNRRKPYSHLPAELQRDIKTFFGSHTTALEEGRTLLFSIGQESVIRQACSEAADLGIGFVEGDQALYVHTSLVEQLPSQLRTYVGCGERLYGSVSDADVIKIHIGSGKLTLLRYDDFFGRPIPRLRERIKIDMRNQRIDFFDYGDHQRQSVLLLKSRFVPKAHDSYVNQQAFDKKLASLGLFDMSGYGPSDEELSDTLRVAGWKIKGFSLVRTKR